MASHNPYASPETESLEPPGPSHPTAFNVVANYTWKSDRLYRIYPDGRSLYFIYLGSSGQTGQVVAVQFGLLGLLMMKLMAKGAKRKQQQAAGTRDQSTPEELLAEHKHNFKVSLDEIVDSTIEPRATFTASMNQVGRWLVTLRDRKLKLEFTDLEHMNRALEHLPKLLPGRVRSNVEWNAKKKRYMKPKQLA